MRTKPIKNIYVKSTLMIRLPSPVATTDVKQPQPLALSVLSTHTSKPVRHAPVTPFPEVQSPVPLGTTYEYIICKFTSVNA